MAIIKKNITVKTDPDNPTTVILSRWPEEDEKPAVRKQIENARRAQKRQ